VPSARQPPKRALILAIERELGEPPGEEPWRGEVLRRAAALQEALRRGEDGVARVAAAALVGLGEGSTPAGDDYLVGVQHALRVGRQDALAADLGHAGHGRTTAASAAWLAAAGRGDASPVWGALLGALAAGDEAAVRAAARAVRGTGHTSGAFSLRGFLDTLAGVPGDGGAPLATPPHLP
jgi:hypothetical protein